MTTAVDLMGLGVPPRLAAQLAEAGVGPVTLVPTGNSPATAAQVYGQQGFVAATSGTGAYILPSPSSANPPGLVDDFIIHNATGPVLTVYAPAGVTINIGGAAYAGANPFSITTLKTAIIWTGPTTTLWCGLLA
jgi:hypothetical protein